MSEREHSLMQRLNVLLGERRRTVVQLAICSTLAGFCEAGTLAIVAEVAVSLAGGKHRVHMHIAGESLAPSVWSLIAVAFGLAVLRLLLQWPLSVLPSRIASEVQATLRRNLFHAYTGASWEVQSRDREGQLQETITSQVMQATGGALGATALINNALTFLTLLVFAFLLNPLATAAIMVSGVVVFGVLQPLKKMMRRRARALSKAQVQFAEGVNEAVRVSEETQVFGVTGAQRRRINRLIDRARNFMFHTMVLSRFVPGLFQGLILIFLIAGLAVWYAAGPHNSSSIAAIVLLLIRSARTGQMSVATIQGLTQSLPFIERTQEAERHYSASAPAPGSLRLLRVDSLGFDHVSYGYRPDRLALADVSFTVRRGEVIGVIGPTGAGKSTLIQLLLQLRRPQEGRYLVNGLPGPDYVSEDWHRLVAYVPQEPRLLHRTVADNIRFERKIELADLEDAARLARIHDEIITWEKGYDTLVGPRADAVSGGQQQRLCLARALVGKPEVLILDEPTSALDPKSEALIQQSLTGLKHEMTMFIIAHRMSTLDICDRVMVILDGRLMAFDTIEHLRTHNAYYRSASAIATGVRLIQGSPS